jgi:hypothetical protein
MRTKQKAQRRRHPVRQEVCEEQNSSKDVLYKRVSKRLHLQHICKKPTLDKLFIPNADGVQCWGCYPREV